MAYMRHRHHHQRPLHHHMQVPTMLPALTMKKEPAAEQVLAQMPIKTEAPTPDELARLLRDRSDRKTHNMFQPDSTCCSLLCSHACFFYVFLTFFGVI